MSARPPGTPANDDERTRISSSPPGGGAPPPADPDATIIPNASPPTTPPAQPPPLPTVVPPPPAAWDATRPSVPPSSPTSPVTQPPDAPYAPYAPTAPLPPYPTAEQQSPYAGQQSPYPGAETPPAYGGYPPQPPYGGTQALPQQPGAPPPYGGAYSSGGYGVTPPPKKKTGLFVGIFGGLIALAAIVGGIFLFTKRDAGGTATTTPIPTNVIAVATQVSGGNILGTIAAAATASAAPSVATPTPAPTRVPPTPTALATATTAATPASTAVASRPATSPAAGSSTPAGSARPGTSPTVGQGGLPPTPTGSARPGTPASSGVALTQTWTDPNGKVKAQYPSGWTVTKLPNSQSNIVEFDGPDGVSFYIDVFRPNGTPADEMLATRTERERSTQFAFTFGTTTDTKVGGEAGKSVSYTVKRKDQPSSTGTDGILWIVNHGGSEYDFETLSVGRHRAEIDAILGSVVFTG